MDTRPAISDTRCCEDRRRGRGIGDLGVPGRVAGCELGKPDVCIDSGEVGRDWTGERVIGERVRELQAVIIGAGLAKEDWDEDDSLRKSVAAFAQPEGGLGCEPQEIRSGSYLRGSGSGGAAVGSSSWSLFQLNPRPMDVTPQLPTLAAR